MVDFAWAAQLLPLMAAGFAVGLLVGLTGVGGGVGCPGQIDATGALVINHLRRRDQPDI